jgi:dGTPase
VVFFVEATMLYSPADEKRVLEVEVLSTAPGRGEFRRDYGRLLHSPSFRRLQGKTQLFPGNETDFFRNRLTHSLEVAQVAKGIALILNGSIPQFQKDPINTDLVELAGLAHDLGHPPFGHNGEEALDVCMKEFGGFEGNAQTLRILGRIEKKVYCDSEKDSCGISPSGVDRRLGLNLTFRGLASVLKYDNEIPETREKGMALVKGYYESERDLVNRIKEHVGKPNDSNEKFKTIECSIMDVADDIAYSTYDLEDAMKGGFSHPMALCAELMANPDLVDRIHKKVQKEIPDATASEVYSSLQELLNVGGGRLNLEDAKEDEDGEEENTKEEYALLAFDLSTQIASQGKFRVGFTSYLVDRFIRGIRIEPKEGNELCFSKVYLERGVHIEIESLKRLNYELVIMSPRLKVAEFRGHELVTTIFEALDSPTGHLLLPEDFRRMYSRMNSEKEKKRLICDFVAGMTDRYAVEFHGRLTGSGESIFKPF